MTVVFDEAKSAGCLVISIQPHHKSFDLTTSKGVSETIRRSAEEYTLSKKLMNLLFCRVERSWPSQHMSSTYPWENCDKQIPDVKGSCILQRVFLFFGCSITIITIIAVSVVLALLVLNMGVFSGLNGSPGMKKGEV